MGNLTNSCRGLCSGQEDVQFITQKKVKFQLFNGAPPNRISSSLAACNVYDQLGRDKTWLAGRPYRLESRKALFYGSQVDALATGKARIIFDDGSFFEGTFQNGNANCSDGLFIHQDGSFYYGSIKDNKANGKGRLVYQADVKLMYDGEWTDNLPQGHGKESSKDGWEYVGYFHEGKKEGRGRLQWPNNDYYEGEFRNGYICGRGKLYLKSQSYYYDGQWFKNKRNGKGEEIFSSGSIFQGHFRNDLRQGLGQWTEKDGSKTKFEYRAGKQLPV